MRATIINNPALKGKRASKATFYGPFKRFALYPIHTRFDAVAWVVSDAETVDTDGLPEIAIFDREQEAIAHAERRAAEAEDAASAAEAP
ncbi:hypothetical protein [Elioraea sp.]|uniref:hypothetical protein n=1 Tax=Elioraea sp. TaxID=2185103 RepID=UPI003F722FFE